MSFTLISVLRLIRDWVNNDSLILADEVLSKMNRFVLTVDDLGELDEFVLEIVQGIRKKVWVPNAI